MRVVSSVRALASAATLLSVAAACTCGPSEETRERHEPSTTPSRGEVGEPTEEETEDAPCTVGAPARIFRVAHSVDSVAIALEAHSPVGDEGGGLVAIAERGEEGLTLVEVDGNGRAIDSRQPYVLPDAGAPFAFVSVGAHHLLLTSHAREEVRALRAFVLRRSPFVVEAHIDTPPLPLFQSLKVAASDQMAVVALSNGVAPASILRIGVADDGAMAVELRERSRERADPRTWDLLGLAARGTVYGVIERVGAAEDPASVVRLTVEGPRRTTGAGTPIDALREAIAIESFALTDDPNIGADIVAAFEFSRPVRARVASNGAIISSEPIPPRGALEGAFAGRLRALLRDRGQTLVVENGAGDIVGQLALPSRGLEAGVADVARTGDGFVVVLSYEEHGGHDVSTVHVRCANIMD